MFFDGAVRDAITDGIQQVVILGTGYDARAWRLRHLGVRFFEVDHPATQLEKQRRAPGGADVTFVPVNFRHDGVARLLRTAGLSDGRSVVIAEGLTMYLTLSETEKMFAEMASVSPAGSRLAANFVGADGGSVAPLSRAVAKVIRARWRMSGETMHHRATPETERDLLAPAGWRQSESMTSPEVVTRHLSNTSMAASGLNPAAFCVFAMRSG